MGRRISAATQCWHREPGRTFHRRRLADLVDLTAQTLSVYPYRVVTHPKGPLEDLAEVKRLAHAGRVEFFKTSARDHLRAKYGDERTGLARAIDILKLLTPDDYEHSRRLPNPPAEADVYGVECEREQWYIKFFTDVDLRPPHDSILKVVSFHPERFTKPAMMKRRKVVLP
jgi:hypothetical protein